MIEIYESSDGWRWRVKGNNGEIVANGEPYSSKGNALRGVTTLMTILESDPSIVFKPSTRVIKDVPQA